MEGDSLISVHTGVGEGYTDDGYILADAVAIYSAEDCCTAIGGNSKHLGRCLKVGGNYLYLYTVRNGLHSGQGNAFTIQCLAVSKQNKWIGARQVRRRMMICTVRNERQESTHNCSFMFLLLRQVTQVVGLFCYTLCVCVACA